MHGHTNIKKRGMLSTKHPRPFTFLICENQYTYYVTLKSPSLLLAANKMLISCCRNKCLKLQSKMSVTQDQNVA